MTSVAVKPSASEITAFERDGYAIVDRLIEPARVSSLLAAMNRVYAGEYNHDRRPPALRRPVVPFGDADSVHWILNARFLDAELWRLATDPVLGERAAALLQSPSVSIVEDQLLNKPPGGRPVNLHQDYGYWAFSKTPDLITCWIALVDVTLAHGTVQVVRGSQRWGKGPKPRELILGTEQEWDGAVKQMGHGAEVLNVVPVVVPAGGGVFFHALTFHGSTKNEAPDPRRACSLHWAAERCRLDLAKTAEHDYPYMFARIKNGGPIVNQYMPQVFPPPPTGPAAPRTG